MKFQLNCYPAKNPQMAYKPLLYSSFLYTKRKKHLQSTLKGKHRRIPTSPLNYLRIPCIMKSSSCILALLDEAHHTFQKQTEKNSQSSSRYDVFLDRDRSRYHLLGRVAWSLVTIRPFTSTSSSTAETSENCHHRYHAACVSCFTFASMNKGGR